MEYNFKKVHTGKDLAISILVLLTGVGLYFLNPGLGICIRLDVYFSKSEKVAYAQVYDFCNYDYEPATGIIELDGDRADKLISLL